jgi:hypothetical protein
MNKSLAIVCAILLCVSCTAEIPPEVAIAASTDEASKNTIARNLVREIRRDFGSDAIITIGSESPRGYDFSPQVKDFAIRAAVAYTTRAPDFVLFYEFEEVDGYFKGRNIMNFILVANLIRTASVNEGAEIIYFSQYRGWCLTSGPSPERYCSKILPIIAEANLYSMRRS